MCHILESLKIMHATLRKDPNAADKPWMTQNLDWCSINRADIPVVFSHPCLGFWVDTIVIFYFHWTFCYVQSKKRRNIAWTMKHNLAIRRTQYTQKTSKVISGYHVWDVIHNQSGCCTAIIHRSQAMVSFLSCSVPYIKFYSGFR